MTRRYDFALDHLTDIEAHLVRNDVWEDIIEWGMGKEMLIRISRDMNLVEGEMWYAVRVEFRHEFSCTCPTLNRAVEFADIYIHTMMDLLRRFGWPAVEND